MEFAISTIEAYVRQVFGQMLEVADRLGDQLINERPHGPETNTVSMLITHCCELTGYWLGHVALGQPTDRHRDSEFTYAGTLADLHERAERAVDGAAANLSRIADGESVDGHPDRLTISDPSDGAIVIHVIEELFQHLGHMELTADALCARGQNE